MTPRKMKGFRIALRNEMWKAFPGAEASAIIQACQRIERLMVERAFDLVKMEHHRDCACWHCIDELNTAIFRHNAKLRAELENANDGLILATARRNMADPEMTSAPSDTQHAGGALTAGAACTGPEQPTPPIL